MNVRYRVELNQTERGELTELLSGASLPSTSPRLPWSKRQKSGNREATQWLH